MSDKVIDIKSGENEETHQQPPKIGYAYLIAFYMTLRIRRPMKPQQDLVIPDAMEMVFDHQLTHSGVPNQDIMQVKKEEFLRMKLVDPNFGEREILNIKTYNVVYWGTVELNEEKKEELIN